ncbi:hypothetical protein D3C87_486320 [compost metagenome]
MIFQLLRFYLDRNQSHGQNDRFLRAFLLQLKLCRPQEDLKFWQFSYYSQKSAIVLSQEVKNLKIIILDKTDDELIKSQKEYVDETIKSYKQNLDIREQLIFIYLTNDLDEENVLAHLLIENKKMIEFLQWRPAIEIKEWVESCVEDLEIENWFGIELNNYLRELKNV